MCSFHSSLIRFSLLLSFCSFRMDAVLELDAMQKAERLSIDPAITVADLEQALGRYFTVVGYRNLQEILDIIVEAKCGWRTAPKAEGLEIVSYVFKVLKPFRFYLSLRF